MTTKAETIAALQRENARLREDYKALWDVANSEDLLGKAGAAGEEKLRGEIDRLKRDLAGARGEASRWYEAFLLAVKERDLAVKELRTVR